MLEFVRKQIGATLAEPLAVLLQNRVSRGLSVLEIKPCGLGSRIRDMEVGWWLRVITNLISRIAILLSQ